MKIHNFEQGTPEWFAVRQLKMTASHAQAISAVGKGLDTYILEIMAEHFSSGEKDFYTNKEMERGNELEPLAREMYELETGNKVEEVGFVEMNEFVGASPDGMVGDDGLIEIKSVNDKNHFKLMLEGIGSIEKSRIWQMQMQMLVIDRKWCDYVSYNPNFKQSLIIHRFERDPAMITKLEIGIITGTKKIQEILIKLKDV